MQPASLGRYTISKKLGRGAMGRVYLAHDPEIDRPVAVKTVEAFEALPPGRQAEARTQFMAEARAAGKLLHPGIVTLFDAGESHGTLYLAMEYVEGDTLDRFTEEPLLPVEVVVEMVASAAEALDYAHRAGVVHRDIKPANLMRVGETAVKIMDFGLAGPMEAQLTADGSLLGTPAYMSPEQVRDQPVDGRSDLFSLGIVLYELLTGQRPFAGESVSSIIYRIVHESPAEIPADGRVPRELIEFLDQAIRKRPEERFTDGAHFATALRASLGHHAAANPQTVAPPQVPRVDRAPAQVLDLPGAAGTSDAIADAFGVATEAVEPPTPEPSLDVTGDPARFETGSSPRARDRARKNKRARSKSGTAKSGGAGPASRRRRGGSASNLPRTLAIVGVLAAVGAAGWYFRDAITEMLKPGPPPVVWLETSVRTEPPGIDIELDGLPIDAAGTVRFAANGPFGTLSAARGCRTTEHVLDPADAGGEIVLLLDETEMSVAIDPGVAGASVQVNGKAVGQTPAEIKLDLCQENAIRLTKDGYRPAEATVAVGALPLATRTTLATLSLEPIPRGKLRFPAPGAIKLNWSVGGQKVPDGQRELELLEGEHVVRVRNDYHYIDKSRKIQLTGGATADVPIAIPELADLVVQAFPPNCKVYLRRPGGRWSYVDDTPFRRKVAVGDFEVRVQLNPTGETQERKVRLGPGDNPPIRVSFGSNR